MHQTDPLLQPFQLKGIVVGMVGREAGRGWSRRGGIMARAVCNVWSAVTGFPVERARHTRGFGRRQGYIGRACATWRKGS